jgi:hypothetical protein
MDSGEWNGQGSMKQQLTALQRAERHSSDFGPGRDVGDLLWLADWRAMGSARCSIYVVSPMDGWPCKIGISTAPAKRVAGLQTSVWKQLKVAWSGFLPTMQQAKHLEGNAHSTLTERALWLHGEWFDLRPDKAEELVKFEAMLLGLELVDVLEHGTAERDFVQKTYDSQYGTVSGMMAKIERDATWRGFGVNLLDQVD